MILNYSTTWSTQKVLPSCYEITKHKVPLFDLDLRAYTNPPTLTGETSVLGTEIMDFGNDSLSFAVCQIMPQLVVGAPDVPHIVQQREISKHPAI